MPPSSSLRAPRSPVTGPGLQPPAMQPDMADPPMFNGPWMPEVIPPYGPYLSGPFPPALHPGSAWGAPGWPQLRPPMYGPTPFLQGPPPWSPQAAWQAYGSPQPTPSGMLRPPTPDPYQRQAAPPQLRVRSPYSSPSSLAPPSPNQHGSSPSGEFVGGGLGRAIEYLTPLIRGEFPKLERPLARAVAACLLQARRLGCAPQPLSRAAPALHPGLEAALQETSWDGSDHSSMERAWVRVLASDLQSNARARSNLHAYAAKTLTSLRQVYVRGSPVADLLAAIGDPGMSERPESCDVFEGALLRLIQQPGLAEPVQELPGPPRPMGLPHAGTCRLPEEVGRWLGGEGLRKHHAGALQDIVGLLADKAGLSISPDIDFGLHQLSNPDTENLSAAKITSHSGNSLSSRHVCVRTITIGNPTAERVMLAHACIMPQRPHTFTLLDDHGLSRDLLQHGNAVALNPGSVYSLAVALDTSDGPWREAESGLMQALVLLTFTTSLSATLKMQYHNTPQECTCCAAIPDAGYAVFTTGRLVTVCLASRSGNVESLLRVDAKPFIASHLKTVFNHRPQQFHFVQLQLAGLFNKRMCPQHAEAMPAYWQPGRGLRSRQEAARSAAVAAASSAVELDALQDREIWPPLSHPQELNIKTNALEPPSVQQLHRLLLLEESAMEADICRHDMFHTRLQFAVARPSRQCGIYSTRAATGDPLQTVLYTGPALHSILARQYPNTPEHLLVILEVPGLPEGRPALVFGDTVYLRVADSPAEEVAAAMVSMRGTQALLAAPPKFWGMVETPLLDEDGCRREEEGPTKLVHVRFSFDRIPMRRMHAALQHACNPYFQLLPDDKGPEEAPALASLAAVEECAASIKERGDRQLNTEQRIAVASVLLQAGGAAPYALFGPPGTGKTVTLVECALQIMLRQPEAKLLLCAPQNYSADLLASAVRKAGVAVADMLRLNDPRLPPNQVKGDVLPFCYLDEALGAFTLPTAQEIRAKRAVVVTCGAAGLLREAFAPSPLEPPITFSHILIDEAGQALLPEALVPLTLLRHEPGCRVLLCGDPKQLGPVVRSPEAASAGGTGNGLSISLLERFIHRNQAQAANLIAQGLAPATGILRQNYRSHASLLSIPNRLFYGDQLQAAADQQALRPPQWAPLRPVQPQQDISQRAEMDEKAVEGNETDGEAEAEAGAAAAGEDGDTLEEAQEAEEGALQEESLPSTLFYGVRGQQVREGEAPSYFNAVEAAVLVELVEGLLASVQKAGARGVRPDDLGVMATYRKQAQKVRQLLRERGLGAVRVGTVDDYQGQEERIIFISTVLSKPESLPPRATAQGKGAVDQHVGFWRNPKRFNVAITRAKALLVVVGHPVVLMEDANWRELLRFCFVRGAYRGSGADLLSDITRTVDGHDGSLFGVTEAQDGEEEQIAKAVAAIAELALLGVGDIDKLFPESLDEAYAAYGTDEMEWRVVL